MINSCKRYQITNLFYHEHLTLSNKISRNLIWYYQSDMICTVRYYFIFKKNIYIYFLVQIWYLILEVN